MNLVYLYRLENWVPSLFLRRLMSCHLPFSSISSSLYPISLNCCRELSQLSLRRSERADDLCFSCLSSISSRAVLSFCGLFMNEYPPLPLVGSANPLIYILEALCLYLRNESVRYQLVSCSCSRITLAIVIF